MEDRGLFRLVVDPRFAVTRAMFVFWLRCVKRFLTECLLTEKLLQQRGEGLLVTVPHRDLYC